MTRQLEHCFSGCVMTRRQLEHCGILKFKCLKILHCILPSFQIAFVYFV